MLMKLLDVKLVKQVNNFNEKLRLVLLKLIETIISRKEFKNDNILFMTLSETGTAPEDMTFHQLYQDVGYQPNIIFRSNDVESILMMVAAEQGISILPSHLTSKLTDAENLVFVPLTGEGEFEQIISVWQAENQSPALKHFLEFIK